jgi:lactate dehydrogenase-like 2-hydroxyacid dehydrogenase
MRQRVLVCREVFDETLAMLAEHFDVESNQGDRPFPPADLRERLSDKDGVLSSTTDRIDAGIVAGAPRLKVVANVGVGYNNLDLPALTSKGIMATNTPGVLTDSVADHTMGLVIATCRRMTEAERFLRAGRWQRVFLKFMLGADVHGATLGIVGFGRIGQAVARRARGFDMKLLYNNRRRLPPAEEALHGAAYRGLHDLLRESDVVVLLTPYSPETHHMVGAAEIALMKPTAVLVNVARGGIVDDAALIAALRERRIRAAGLDVFENEPAFDPGFLELDNVVLTPHIASASEPTRRAMADTAARNCIAALTGGEPPHLLNPEARAARPAG